MTRSTRIVLNSAVLLVPLLSTLPLRAGDALEVQWNKVCQVANGHELLVRTAAGDTVQGICLSVNVDEMAVRTKDNKIVRVARSTMSRLDMYRSPNHQLRSLGKGMHAGLKEGSRELLSPKAVAGIAMIPGTLAWGAISAPFCALGDLKSKLEGTRQIKPI
jgi:hypothetical protein